MSAEQLKAFLEAVKGDAGLQEKLKAANNEDAVVAIAKAAGFAISCEELKKATQTELKDEELAQLAGGKPRWAQKVEEWNRKTENKTLHF